jgi:polyphosphate kinase
MDLTDLSGTTDPLLLPHGLRVVDDDDDDPVLLRPDGTPVDTWREGHPYGERMSREEYDAAKRLLQIELLKLQYWAKDTGGRIVILFEGRDAAGKGGTIKRFMEHLNPRGARVVALEKPSEREQSQWYFQRYTAHLPSAGEIVLFDRSWYNRAGVERVLGFCTPAQHQLFLRQCPTFERMLIEDGILLTKYWFSVSDEEQLKRFRERIKDETKRWKLSPMDLESRSHYIDYSRAKDEMFVHTDLPESPWFVVEADDKRRARLNCMSHLLSRVPYEDRTPGKVDLPPRQSEDGYRRPDRGTQKYVPDHAASLG